MWVGENLAHYYVLSRFLISRMLTVTKVPQMKVSTAEVGAQNRTSCMSMQVWPGVTISFPSTL